MSQRCSGAISKGANQPFTLCLCTTAHFTQAAVGLEFAAMRLVEEQLALLSARQQLQQQGEAPGGPQQPPRRLRPGAPWWDQLAAAAAGGQQHAGGEGGGPTQQGLPYSEFVAAVAKLLEDCGELAVPLPACPSSGRLVCLPILFSIPCCLPANRPVAPGSFAHRPCHA